MRKSEAGSSVPAGLLFHASGFSLLELLAVACILALTVAVSAPVISGKVDQMHFDSTVKTMAEIEKGLLGVTSDRVKGKVRFAGYVQDMGGLPRLYDDLGTPGDPSDDQPMGLWTSGEAVDKDSDGASDGGDLDDDGRIDLIFFKGYTFGKEVEFVRIGWRGPYIKAPVNNVLTDGWGNPLAFETVDGDYRVTSLGADGKKGGEGYDRDIVYTVKTRDYTASVSGYVSPHTVFSSAEEMHWAGYNPESNELPPVQVRIYYTPDVANCELTEDSSGSRYRLSDCLAYMATVAESDGYFLLEGVPVGTERLLMVVQKTRDDDDADRVGMGYKIAVEQGALWLGTPGAVP